MSEQDTAGKKHNVRSSLAVQWLRIRLPVHGTQVRSLVREDLTSHRAARPVHHGYRSLLALEPVRCNKGSHGDEKLAYFN